MGINTEHWLVDTNNPEFWLVDTNNIVLLLVRASIGHERVDMTDLHRHLHQHSLQVWKRIFGFLTLNLSMFRPWQPPWVSSILWWQLFVTMNVTLGELWLSSLAFHSSLQTLPSGTVLNGQHDLISDWSTSIILISDWSIFYHFRLLGFSLLFCYFDYVWVFLCVGLLFCISALSVQLSARENLCVRWVLIG